MNPRSVSALLLSRQMPLASSTTAAYQGIVTNFANKDQHFCDKIEVSYGLFAKSQVCLDKLWYTAYNSNRYYY